MKIIAAIASILIIIGALNWGLYGIAKIDIIENFFGGWNNKIGRIVYILIGVAGLYSLLYVIFAWSNKKHAWAACFLLGCLLILSALLLLLCSSYYDFACFD